jgi:hypothetical protein
MFSDQFNNGSRGLEMFESGEGADCVIEIMAEQIDGQQLDKKVYYFFWRAFRLCHPFGIVNKFESQFRAVFS